MTITAVCSHFAIGSADGEEYVVHLPEVEENFACHMLDRLKYFATIYDDDDDKSASEKKNAI